MAPPVVKGHSNGTALVIDTTTNAVGSAAAAGDWMVCLWAYQSNTGLRVPGVVAPFTERVPMTGIGTMGWGVWCGTRQAGDSSYTYALGAGTQTPFWTLIWGSGSVPDAQWVYGAAGLRANSGNSNDVIAPSITVPADSLVLAVGNERTTTTETLAQITAPAGWTKDVHVNPTTSSSFEMWQAFPAGGATGTVKVTWPNPHASNGVLMLVGLPGPRTGRPKVWTGAAFASKPARVWNGTAWVEKPVKTWDGSQWVLAK